MIISSAIPLTQLTLAAASIGAAYTLVGTFTAPLEMMTIVSTMDQAVQVSFDGVNDHQAVPVGDTTPAIIPFNFKSNQTILPKISVYVKEIGNPTTGSLFVSGFSAQIP